MHTLNIQNRQLEYLRLPSSHPKRGAPSMVFLHEGLGSIGLWRDFPQRLADATGCEAVVYSRYGYGRSTPLAEPRQPDYMHVEALQVLPELLDRLGIEAPLLFGHSDGASIALIHAGGAGRRVSGVIALAPHVMVEDVALASIAEVRRSYQCTDLSRRLARHHLDADRTFHGWNDIWLHPDFRGWNIEGYLATIGCPILAIQGENDEYATMDQIDRISRQANNTQLIKLADCRHSPHVDQAAAVISATVSFVARAIGPHAP